jgi:hypothetical protein
MPRLTTAQSLIDIVKARIDEDESDYLTTSFLLEAISSSYAEVYDILTSKWENYNLSFQSYTITQGTVDYALPADFYKLADVFVTASPTLGGTTAYRLDRLDLQDAVALSSQPNPQYCSEGYILLGTTIRLILAGLQGTVQLWYVPAVPFITAVGDVIDGVNGWEELLVLLAMKKALMRGEKPTNLVEQEIARQYARLEAMSSGRDGSQPRTVRRIANRYPRYPYRRLA